MKSILIAACMLGSTVALAQEASSSPENVMSTRSRAEVRAELDAARADGALVNRGEVTEFRIDRTSTRERAQVRAEALAARANGLVGSGEAQLRGTY
ncbi:MAG TPA: DUF4148 domain-containing protein [Burkholderiaceae bacterium]|nr:DUF4148 domain-containing protein [Burkholderiaceae bacterium]